jgi:uncharacterized RDD family membrane protein YckC
MLCPRCHGETGHAAIRCADCGAPLALPADLTPRPLDRSLSLDRRGPERPAERPGGPPFLGHVREPAFALTSTSGTGWPAAPAVIPVPPPGTPLELLRAPSPRRVLAWLVDGLPFALAAVGLAAGLGGGDPALLPPLLAVVALAAFVYQLLSHALLGATFGQRLLGLAVVGPDGRRPGPWRAALRALVAVLGTACLGVGPLLALFTRTGRALHDLVAGTAVVATTRPP